ncbi:MAG: NAD(P)/FAD-dependent oxidoreductase [Bifidobacteriaceae bacterium]|jgi:sulfide:quinone oxidoreductase|nr:NAD(P)/FAD-dependent oxidoreductase [Bifidobacteriaceae bacterium]
MKNIVILGGGTAGTLLANKLSRRLSPSAWRVTVVDRDTSHHYQPGYLFVPFGRRPVGRLTRDRRRLLPRSVVFKRDDALRVDPETRQVALASGEKLDWDRLVIATGTQIRPDAVEGMASGQLWGKSVFDFYTLEGASRLRQALSRFDGGRIVVHIAEMPIKCPVAPLEFALLAQDWARKRGRLSTTDIALVTPLDGPFTKPVASARLGELFRQRGVEVVTDFQIERVDNDRREIVSYDGRREPFDLLVTVPPNRGAKVIANSGLGDESGFVATDRATGQSEAHPDIWVAGDATNMPTSKAGSVAHFQAEALVPNLLAQIDGQPPPARFDGHSNCFIESGRGQALLLDFNYGVEPLPGVFPLPQIGPFKLLAPSAVNHWGKLAFEPVYWHIMVKGRPLPLGKDLSLAGKQLPANLSAAPQSPTGAPARPEPAASRPEPAAARPTGAVPSTAAAPIPAPPKPNPET